MHSVQQALQEVVGGQNMYPEMKSSVISTSAAKWTGSASSQRRTGDVLDELKHKTARLRYHTDRSIFRPRVLVESKLRRVIHWVALSYFTGHARGSGRNVISLVSLNPSDE